MGGFEYHKLLIGTTKGEGDQIFKGRGGGKRWGNTIFDLNLMRGGGDLGGNYVSH